MTNDRDFFPGDDPIIRHAADEPISFDDPEETADPDAWGDEQRISNPTE